MTKQYYFKKKEKTILSEESSRKLFFNKLNKSYKKLKNNKKECEDYLNERQEWESFNNHHCFRCKN